MEDFVPLLPALGEAGATIIVIVLLFFYDKSSKRQHERSMARDRDNAVTIQAINSALMDCVKTVSRE